MKRMAVFAPLHNKQGKKDATGAFQPEATKFCQLHGVSDSVHLIDNHDDALEMRESVYQVLDAAPAGTFEAVLFFCHGFRSGLQFGFGMEHIRSLALRIKRASVVAPTIVLYACDAARDMDRDEEDDRNDHVGGDGGFADRLRDELNDQGCRATVFAHSTAGHTTQNPHLRTFLPNERFGGRFVVAKDSGLWKKWSLCMRTTDLRFRVPFMEAAALESELST